MTTVHTLASGSSGNALLLSCGTTHLLVDAGISCRRITTALREIGVAPEALTAILITHTHADHISGLQVLLKKTTCPVRAFGRTCRELEYRLTGITDRLLPMEAAIRYTLGSCTVTAFPTSHDAPGSCGYRFDTADGSVGLMTDTGFVTQEAADILPGVDLAVLESNHDVEAVRSFAVTLAEHGTSEIVLAHLSRENNTPAMARTAVETALSAAGLAPALSVAPRDRLSEPYTVCRRAVCRK